MKVNISSGRDIRSGYINVVEHPLADSLKDLSDTTSVIVGKYSNLDPIFKDGTLDEIVFNPPMNTVSPHDIIKVIQHWSKKLKVNGALKFSAIDIRLLGKALSDGSLDLEDTHMYIFGPNYEHRCVMDAESLKFIVSNLGFKVENMSINGFFINIEALKIE